jgi:uncharacterized protein (TIGR03083 family)
MDNNAYLRSIERDSAVIAAVADRIPLDTPVPSCPEWTLRDLVVHTGVVHRHKTEIVRDGWLDEGPPEPDGPDIPDGDIAGWFRVGVVDLLDTFDTADLTQPSWTWCDHDHTADWWVRRMAHETAIHAADAQLAASEVPSLDPRLGVDGVDEILDEMMVGGPAWATITPRDRVFALEAEDRRWVLRTAYLSGTSPVTGNTYEDVDTLVRDDGAPEAVVRTDPSTLDLWLWGRISLTEDAVAGDSDLVLHVRELAAEATQ